jgi:prolyl oligopeptidase
LAISNGVIAAPQVLALPYAGTVGTLDTNQTNDGAVFELESWTRPALWYKYDPETGSIRDTGLQKAVAADTSNLVAKEVSAVSYDGTMVPLSIIMKAGTKLDGHNPTILIGYGSYGATNRPGFDASSLPWFNRGGITAIAHVRGGGWYGEDWHKAGTKLTKLNTILDFIACAQYLIDQHYTSQHFLAGKGSSAGGITIGGAITWRPDLFAVAIDSHGNTNTLRAQFTPNGPPNIREFGSISTRDGFHGLYAMSAYHHVHDGVSYPAVLLETGANDPRVEPWIVAKMAARLQAATSSRNPVLLTVSYDSGHGIGSTKAQNDSNLADEIAFMLWQMGVPAFQPRSGPGGGN